MSSQHRTRIQLVLERTGDCPACGKFARSTETVGRTVAPLDHRCPSSVEEHKRAKEEIGRELRRDFKGPVYHTLCEPMGEEQETTNE